MNIQLNYNKVLLKNQNKNLNNINNKTNDLNVNLYYKLN